MAKTEFGRFLKETVTDPEAYANRVLPLLSIVETIATKGKGPSMAEKQQQTIYGQAARNREREKEMYERQVSEEQRSEEAKSRALARKKTEMEIAQAEKKAQTDEAERARLLAYRQKVAEGADPVEAWKIDYAEEYAPMAAKPKERVTIQTTLKELGAQDVPTALMMLDKMNKENPDYKFVLRPEGTDPFALAGYKAGLEQQGKEIEKEDQNQKAALEKQGIIDIADEILNDPARSTGFSFGRLKQLIPGTPDYAFAQKVQNLISKLSLEQRQKLKGSGQISDKEQEMLRQAVTMLSTNLGPKEFEQELRKIKQALSGTMPQQPMQQPVAPAQQPAAPPASDPMDALKAKAREGNQKAQQYLQSKGISW